MRLIQHVEIDQSWPEFGCTFAGRPVRLADVEELFPAGSDERTGVYFESPADARTRVYPWKEAGYYIDDDGQALAPTGPLERRMPRTELVSLGFTDEKLEELHAGYHGRDPLAVRLTSTAEDTRELQVLRRRLFDEMTAAAYAPTDAPPPGTGGGASFTPGKS